MSDEIEQGGEPSPIEAEAREMGWRPKEDFKGDPEKWTDAETWVERGHHILPILQANNKRLKQDLASRDGRISSLEKAVRDSQEAVAALKKAYEEDTKRQVERAKDELRAQIRAAREEGDTDTELDLRDKLDDLREREKVAKAEAPKAETPAVEQWRQEFPELSAWQKEHSWYGDFSSEENRKKTRALNRIMEDLRDEGEASTGGTFLNKALAVLESKTRPAAGKVEGGTSNGTPTSGRKFDKLPKDAREMAKRQASDFVGPNRMFKTNKEWEDYYAEQYGE